MHILQRVVFHGLLAFFLANAANKFFIPDLPVDAIAYGRIFEFKGDAPDQWRILTLLPLKWLCGFLSFNHATLVYNFLTGWLCLELLWRQTESWKTQIRLLFSIGFSASYIYFLYTGWRPDTMALLLACQLSLLPLEIKERNWLKYGLIAFGILALSFCRADIALVYLAFMAFHTRKWALAALAIVPVVVQLALKYWIFPEAAYYTKPFMLWDNLSGKYLFKNPSTYLILAFILAFGVGNWDKLWRHIRENSYFYTLFAAYILLVLFVGRLNEYRLYLPFLPLFLLGLNGRNHH